MTATAKGLTPTSALVGDQVRIYCQGFPGNAPVTIVVGTKDAVIVGQSTTGPLGSLTATFVVPEVPDGLRKVTVSTPAPVTFGGLSTPTFATITAVSPTYLTVGQALVEPLPTPTGSGLPGSGLPGPGPGGVSITPGIPLGGTITPVIITGAISESAAAVRASQLYDEWRGIVGPKFTEAEYLYNDIAASVLEQGTTVTFTEVGAGVTVDLLSFPLVAFAGFLLLSEYGFGWLLKKVARLFPNPSIAGWHPLGFIVRGINNFGGQFEQSATDLGDRIGNLFLQPFRQVLGLFQRSGNATAAAHNKIGAVVRNHIPAAQQAAIDQSGAYTDLQIAQLTRLVNRELTDLKNNINISGITADISALNTKITGISDTLGPLHDQVNLNTAQLAPFEAVGAVALPTLLATLGSTLNKLKTKVDECMVDNCDTTSPNYLKTALLHLLVGLTDVAELAFLAEAIHDPVGVANAISPSLEAVDAGAVATLNALLSL